MTYNEYQKATETTEIRPQTATVNLRLMCSICGLMEEVEELEAITQYTEDKTAIPSMIKEAGDVLYYVASIARETGIDLESIAHRELKHNIPKMLPLKLLKKTYRDMDGVMSHAYKEQLWDYLKNLLHYIRRVCIDDCRVPIETVMETNIDKLQDRLKRGVIQGDGDTR